QRSGFPVKFSFGSYKKIITKRPESLHPLRSKAKTDLCRHLRFTQPDIFGRIFSADDVKLSYMAIANDYLKKLRKRAEKSHVYKKYQLIGLEIAQILGDKNHKSLYIKLAKERGSERLLRLAKEVAERPGVKNKGAYFMSMIKR
ncbi:MAG: hypothetical protein Q7R94_03005, partial [bacterium]|nr:hypothetical protein [bacterium]